MILKAIILGIIEGLTEFLPVSSTGHLIIANKYIDFTGQFANAFNIVIQVGAILAVLIYFKDKIFPQKRNIRQTRSVYRLWAKVMVGFIPAAILGFLFDDYIDEHFFNPTTVSIALILGALLLLFAEAKLKRVKVRSTDELTFGQSFVVGIAQCMALMPGMSRSASTIIGGLFLGLSREVAAEFSFFLAIPTIMGAAAYKLFKVGFSYTAYEWLILLIGTAVSFIVALLVIAFFMNYLKKRKLAPFAYYRIILGMIVLFVA
ncbi:undecaprenyl-diphosphate phosphatase [Thermotalea metallivorans]|uniref:Undecaprenyl-diphosphatase n=1 Tax=Thermotalea metallivorans TaxID=520762 RepID=A0A140L4K4_9FIRM|nr:undecaprenyl-diphosphate phosphatase [Thermotalea metallivorans]KXG75479.1 Undecaprenyl-diphosphatase [Thermotalea metallivorans]